jgi:hypothetical protein
MTTRRLMPAPLVRHADAGDLLERFLVAAVAAFLGIRVYLAATNYPQLGGHGLHIAHMLWGGLLMLVALVLILCFLGQRVRILAAFVGGAGFGTFIDELGKFITSDNDYFYRPTFTLIYAIFLLLFLAFHALGQAAATSPKGALARAIDETEEAILHGFRAEDRERVLRLLEQADPTDPVVRALRQAIQKVEPASAHASLAARIGRLLGRGYFGIVRRRWFLKLVVGLFLLHVLLTAAGLVVEIAVDPAFSLANPSLSFSYVDAVKTLSSATAAAFAGLGLLQLRRSRLAAFVWFRRSLFVSLFLVQFFSFYAYELTAAAELLLNVVLLTAVTYAIRREQASPATASLPAAQVAAA